MLHVNVGNGSVCYSTADFSLPGFFLSELERNYKSDANYNGLLGLNWNSPLDGVLTYSSERFAYRNRWGASISIPFPEPYSSDQKGDNGFKLYRIKHKDTIVHDI